MLPAERKFVANRTWRLRDGREVKSANRRAQSREKTVPSGSRNGPGSRNLRRREGSSWLTSGPVRVAVVAEREDVVRSHLPRRVLLGGLRVLDVRVVGRGGVERRHGAALRGVDIHICPRRKLPFSASKRPACPHKSAIEDGFTVKNAEAA